MPRGGATRPEDHDVLAMMETLHQVDCRIDDTTIRHILACGDRVIPYLEGILAEAIDKSTSVNVKTPSRDRDWFVAIHALYLLAELRASDSLPLVLRFLAQKQDILDYWLHELLDEDVWEVIYFMGEDRVADLRAFALDQENNVFSRLAVCTALVQIALHHPEKKGEVVATFQELLAREEPDPDFVGLVVNEVLDLKSAELKPAILSALLQNEVWSGIITAEEVEWSYANGHLRKLRPLNIFERYKLFRQYTHFTAPTPTELSQKVRRKVQDLF